MIDDIKLTKLNRQEGARYMGYGENIPDETVMKLVSECETAILAAALPRYIYKIFDIRECENGVEFLESSMVLKGNSIDRKSVV